MMLTASYVLLTLGGGLEQVRSGMTYVVISLIASTLFVTALGAALLGDRHGQHGRPRDPDRRAAHRACRRAFAVLLAGRLRHQGRDVPAVLLAARQLPDRAVADHRGVRRAADQGRRLRDHPHPDAVVPRRTPGRPRCCSCVAARDDGGRRPRRHRPGRHPPDPVVHDRQPDRLHDHGPRRSSPSPASPRSSSRSSTTSS